MEEIKFRSVLSEEEITAKFKDADVFSGIMSGLEESLEYETGSARAATVVRKRNLPDVSIVDVRKDLGLSQKLFAEVLGVSRRTVEAWESGRSVPTPTARNLIYLISQDHSLADKLLAVQKRTA